VPYRGRLWHIFRTTDPVSGNVVYLFHEDVPPEPSLFTRVLTPLQRTLRGMSLLTLEIWWERIAAWAQALAPEDVLGIWVRGEQREWVHCLAAWFEVTRWIQATHALAVSLSSMTRLDHLLADVASIVKAMHRTSLETIWNDIARHMCHMFDADAAYLLRWDTQRNTPVPVAAVGPLAQRYASLSVTPRRRTLTASVLNANRVIAVEDVLNSPFIDLDVALLFPQRSLLGLPLIHEEQRLGAVLLAWDEPRTF